MKRIQTPLRGGFTLVELMITSGVVGVVGLILYAVLNANLVLAAKNTAINATHQETRIARLNMLQDIHSSVSAPYLTDATGAPYNTPPTSGFAEGIAFQKWAADSGRTGRPPMKPLKIYADAYGSDQTAKTVQNYVQVAVPTGWNPPLVGQTLIMPTHQIEADIQTVATASGAPAGTTGYKLTLYNFRDGSSINPSNNLNLPVSILGTGSTGGDVVCFVTDRCSYTVKNGTLYLTFRGVSYPIGQRATVANSTPFYMPSVVTGVSFAFSSSDMTSQSRGYRSTNVLLNGQVPIKAQLTTYQ